MCGKVHDVEHFVRVGKTLPYSVQIWCIFDFDPGVRWPYFRGFPLPPIELFLAGGGYSLVFGVPNNGFAITQG